MAEIGVIGSGSWGTALALVLNKNGHHVTIWSYLKEEADEIRKKRENPSKLPGVHIPEEIEITTDPVSYTHLDVYKRQVQKRSVCI